MSNRQRIGIMLIALGVFLALSSTWVGGYYVNTLPKEHWAQVPMFVTIILAWIAAFAACFGGSFLLEKQP